MANSWTDPEPEIRNWTPSLRDRIADLLQGVQTKFGRDKYQAGETARNVNEALDYGGAYGLIDARDALEKSKGAFSAGHYGTSALEGGLGMLTAAGTVLPVGGKVTKAIERAAPKVVNLAKRFQSGEKEGIYRGSEAFGGITPAKLGSMRANYIESAQTGAPYSKYWYDNTSKDIYRITGQNPDRADILADILATTSSSTPVGSNAMYGFKGWNQNLAGDAVNTGKYPTRMSSDIENIIAGTQTASGLKRSPYAGGLSVEWRPDPNLLAVNDIHNVRAWGIPDPKTGGPWKTGVGDAGHRFLQEQHAVVSDRLNDIAAANIAKAKAAGASEAEIARMDQPDWNNYRAQAAAWSTQRNRGPQKIKFEDAGKHYGDFLDEYSGQIPRSWENLAGDSSPETRRILAEALEGAVTGPQGIDRVASGMGALTNTTMRGAGDDYASRVLVGKELGGQAMDESSHKVLDAVAGAHGLFSHSPQMSTNYVGGAAPIGQAGAFQVRRGSPFGADELAELRAKALMGETSPLVDPQGARIMLQPGEGSRELLNDVRGAASEFGATVEPRFASGSTFPEQAAENWSSKPYIEKIEQGGPRMVENFNREMPAVAGDVLRQVEEQSAKLGITQAPYYKTMMEGIAKGGLPELKRLVQAGIVPVAALAAFGLQQPEEGGMQ